jgi:adenylate cyclase
MTQPADSFSALLESVCAALAAEQRVSYRGLKRRFGLSDDDLADIKDELIHARRVAADEAGTVLVWCGPPVDRRQPGHSYTPRHTEQVLSNPSAVEGEKKQVTVLFCDVVGSMVLAETLGAEGWHELLSGFFTALNAVVHALEGTVNQYTGDGVMALFGAPIACEDHALRACLASLRIRAAMATLDARLKAEHGLAFDIRIGLNSGEVVVGSIGDDIRMDYTAQGQVVGIAARLESMAEPNIILMSETCHRQVADYCGVRSLGKHPIKGVSAPLEVFELLSVEAGATRFEAERLRGLSRFVGREEELAILERAHQAALSGSGLVVGVVADAGTGKSRLCHEFLESCRRRGMTVLTGYARAHGTHIPYLPMLQIFRTYYGIVEGEDADSARSKISDRLRSLGESFADAAPLVQELLGVASRETTALDIDPDAKQRRLLDLLRRIVQSDDAAGGAVVTCIEDLHWLDAASERFLDHWVDALPGSRRLLVVSFRPGFRAEWMSRPHYLQLPLAALRPAEVAELLSDLLGNDPSTAGLAASLSERTGGNPFFCEEIVRNLAECGDLTPSPMGYRLRRPLQELRIPASVQSVLSARIDRLGPHEKALLQVAAVIGREFPQELLQHASNLSSMHVAGGLRTLKNGEFIYEHASGAGPVYQFKHALTQEVAVHSQLRDKVRKTHARVAQAFEALYPDQLDERAGLLAYHLENAGEPLAAALACGRAAVHIRSGNRSEQMGYIRRALRLTENLPPSPPRQELRLQGLVELIAGGAWRFSMTDAELDRLCDEARELAEAAGMRELSIMVRSGRCAASGMMAGDIVAWSRVIEELAGLVGGVSPECAEAVLCQCSYARYSSGRLDRALELALRSQRTAGGDPRFGLSMGYSVLGAALNCAALIQTALGRLDDALKSHRDGIAVLTASGVIEELIWNQGNQSESILCRGLPADHPLVQEGASNAFKAHERAEQVASDFTRGVAKRGRTVAMLMQGRSSEAEAAAVDCLAHLRDRRAHLEVEARCLAFLADAQRGVGKIDAALRSAREAIARSRVQGARYFEGCALLSLARALMADGRSTATEEAASALQLAEAAATACGAKVLLPQILEQRARLVNQQQRGDAASALLRDALDGYRSTGADGHARRLAAELG